MEISVSYSYLMMIGLYKYTKRKNKQKGYCLRNKYLTMGVIEEINSVLTEIDISLKEESDEEIIILEALKDLVQDLNTYMQTEYYTDTSQRAVDQMKMKLSAIKDKTIELNQNWLIALIVKSLTRKCKHQYM